MTSRGRMLVCALAVLAGCKSGGGEPDAGRFDGGAGAGGGAAGAGGGSGSGGASGAGIGGAGGHAGDAVVDASAPRDAATDSSSNDARAVDPGTSGDGNVTIMPPYTAHPDVVVKPNVPHGKVYSFTLPSQGTLFDGLDKSLAPANQHGFTRGVRVYVPKQYVDGMAAPFMVVQDGFVVEVQNALDNLIAAKKVPVMLAVFVDNGGGDGQDSERGLEYDTMSDRYSRFIDTNVLPAVMKDPGIKADYPKLAFTDDPEGRASYGCSSGAAAALTQGWFTPDRYRRIITYSGTFVAQQDNMGVKAPEAATYPWGAWEYHSDSSLIANSPQKPLRIFLNVNENDLDLDARFGDMRHNWITANQRTAAALQAKGYHHRFVFAKGAGHCDAGVRRATLPDALVWVWRGYPID